MKYTMIVNVNLEYEFEAKNPEEAKVMVENIELPKNYVRESLELIKAIDEKGNETSF